MDEEKNGIESSEDINPSGEPSSDESMQPENDSGQLTPEDKEVPEMSEDSPADPDGEGLPGSGEEALPESGEEQIGLVDDESAESESGHEGTGLLSQEDIDQALGDMGDQPADDGSFNIDAPEINQADFQQLSASSDDREPANIELLMDVDLPVSIELGRTKMKISDILALGPGAIVELDKLVGEPVDLLVNQKCVARGEVVVVEESFGLRITQLVSPEERLKKLQ